MKAPHFSKKRPLLFLISLHLILTAQSVKASSPLPDLGAPDLITYDATTEKKLGDAFSTALHQHTTLINTPEALSLIREMGQRITQQVQPPRAFTFYLIDLPSINAFAGPNGIIGIHKGLILKTDTEDELAAVIAHEVAHVTQHHLSRTLKQQSKYTLASFANLLAALLIGSQNPSAGFAVYLGGTGINLQQQLKQSRLHESEADNIGMQYLSQAGYNPQAMAQFFAKLQDEARLSPTPPEILSTHPVTQHRLAEAENRAQQLPHHPNTPSLNLHLLQIHLTSQPPSKQTPPFPRHSIEHCYQKNLQWLEQLPPKTGTPDGVCLTHFLQKHPQNKMVRLLYARLLNATKQPQQAQQQYNLLNTLYPHTGAIAYRYAQYLAQHHQIKKAIQYLLSHQQTDTPVRIYQMLAKYYGQIKDSLASNYYQALANQTIGNQARYHILLSRVQKYLKTHPTQHPEIKKAIEKLKPPEKTKEIQQNPLNHPSPHKNLYEHYKFFYCCFNAKNLPFSVG